MRLKTKFQDEDFDLGEVVEANAYRGGSGRIKIIAKPAKGGMITFYFETLKEMNEMFEDATEEPNIYYFIDVHGEVKQMEDLGFDWQNKMKQIGNYFESKEKAEEAVEKLKAWKRLKDKGFKVDLCDLWDYDGGNYQAGRILFRVKDYEKNDNDLGLLFGVGDTNVTKIGGEE